MASLDLSVLGLALRLGPAVHWGNRTKQRECGGAWGWTRNMGSSNPLRCSAFPFHHPSFQSLALVNLFATVRLTSTNAGIILRKISHCKHEPVILHGLSSPPQVVRPGPQPRSAVTQIYTLLRKQTWMNGFPFRQSKPEETNEHNTYAHLGRSWEVRYSKDPGSLRDSYHTLAPFPDLATCRKGRP